MREQQSSAYEYDHAVPPQAFLVDLGTGAMTRLFADLPVRPRSMRWTSDGRASTSSTTGVATRCFALHGWRLYHHGSAAAP